ncbi:TlpA family protein disulfide reductase [Thiohalorhabdus sp.]|uniref:TlpA family protein disulfide reductase n=1 Tax=Thiohalorhabdus sp. TaxID=3094134 RepID=UPI002FC3198E
MTTERLPVALARLALALLLLVPVASPGAPKAPALEVETLSKERLSLTDYRGKLVLVNFWAPWCPPCRQEMPDLQAFHTKYEDTVVLGLAVNYRSKGNVTNMVDMMNITYPVAYATPEVADKFGSFRGLPQTFLISPEGRVVEEHAGLLPADRMEAYREQILGPTAGTAD